MKNPLATYLSDHLAGAAFALELLSAIRDQHGAEPLGVFAAELRSEIIDSRDTLKRIADRVGTSTNAVKELAGWVAEKASRVKLRHDAEGGLGTFEALETLALGLTGQIALWTALARIAPREARLQGIDFAALLERTRAQRERVEVQRLEWASRVFAEEK